jgi:hypothetical protein
MASIDRSDPIILGHVLAEHRDLFCRLSSARAAFRESGPTAAAVQEVGESLRGLRDHLAEHFSQEERGGFLEESVARMPRLGAAVAAIMRQHPVLLAELDTIIARLSSSGGEAGSWRQAADDFEAFATHMLAHERSENAVVQEGYNEDLGLVD